MSDHNTPHPIDRAYAEAEGFLDGDTARCARRARVLEAVAREPAPQTMAPPTPARRVSGWRYVGWLTAASIAGLGGLIAYQLSPVAGSPPVAAPGQVSSEPRPPSAASPPPASDVQARAPAPPEAPPRAASSPEERLPEIAQNAAAPVAPPKPVAPPPVAAPESGAAPPPPAAFPQERLDGFETRRTAAAPVAAPAPAPSAQAQGGVASRAALGARLRAAAAAGRTSEIAELLSEGAPIDARDDDGETALMKSIRAGQPETAALLRRRGANPDLENRAGVSAREMAEAAANPALERALAPDR